MKKEIEVWKYDRKINWFLSIFTCIFGLWLLVATTADIIPELQKPLATVGCGFIFLFGIKHIPGKIKDKP